MRFSRLEGDTWSEATTIASGRDLFVNWADFPSPARARDGSLYAHWLVKSGKGAYAYDVHVARSSDRGRTWSPLGKLNDDATESEHGFVSFVQEEGGVRAFWLDGREMAAEGEGHGGGEGENGHGGGDHAGSMGLRTALVGAKVEASVLLDARTCECCQTAAVVTARGTLVAYRDRSEGEIRDISFVTREADAWSEPRTLHADRWEVPGCPVNGPSLASSGETVVAAWYTAERNRGRVLAAFSADSGATFGTAIEIDSDQPMGRVDVDLLPDGDAVVTWLAASEEEGVIRLRRVDPAGRAGAATDLAKTLKSRAAGFPRAAVSGSRIIVAWTASGEPSRVRAAWMDASGLPYAEGERSAPGEAASDESAKTLPSLAVSDLEGKRSDLRDLRGQPVLLNLWATWCAPCRLEMPDLAKLHHDLSPKGLKVVGLSIDAAGAMEDIRTLVRNESIPYLIVHDVEGKAASLFDAATLPASFLYDRSGQLVWERRGPLTAGDPSFQESLAAALATDD